MRILALGSDLPGLTDEDFLPYKEAERKRVLELYQLGIIREIYFRVDSPDAVLLLECEDKKAAEETLATLPLVQQKLIHFEVIPLVPYPGFDPQGEIPSA